MLNKNEKQQLVEDLHQKFIESKIVILTDYKGLDVDTINELRRKLTESNIEYRVVKNTLLARASEDTDVALVKDQFKGPTAIAISYDDPVAPAKVLCEFAKDHNKLEIKVGVMSGKLLDIGAINNLSALPSREVLLSQLLSTMNGVSTAFVRALNNVPEKLLYALQAIKDQKEAA